MKMNYMAKYDDKVMKEVIRSDGPTAEFKKDWWKS